jgi:aspartyl aminopeptidase
MNAHQQAQALLDFIDESPSPWHAVASIERQLKAFGFKRLDETHQWTLSTQGRYYVVRGDGSIIAFVLGKNALEQTGFKMVGAHTDSPSLRIKPNPITVNQGLAKLQVEVYGSPILASFSDRELSLAGRVNYQTAQGEMAQQLVRIDQPLLRLPNLAIHLNRGVNEEGLKFHKQHELGLILGCVSEQLSDWTLLALIEAQLPSEVSQLLAWDLNVYDTQKGHFWGKEQAFYANGQIDNLASCHGALQALLDESVLDCNATLVCAFFDHEEVGSESYHGAAGRFLIDILRRISQSASNDEQVFARALAHSFFISADMAHAYHPNFSSMYDAQHLVHINQGIVIKINLNQRYNSDSVSQAMFMRWCQQAEVPYQIYSHRNDLPCGSTIGPIISTKLGVRGVDIGNPMWAMHSCRESAGVFDHSAMIAVLKCFFNA